MKDSSDKPKVGSRLKCNDCGFEIEVKSPCLCDGNGPQLSCCDRPLALAAIEDD